MKELVNNNNNNDVVDIHVHPASGDKAEGTFDGDELVPYNEDEEEDGGGGGTTQAPPPPETTEIEFPNIENLLEYKFKFPSITEMLYGIKVCNNTSDEQAQTIERKLMVGVGITICRNLMAETGKYGESIMMAKKESYRGIFQTIMNMIRRREEYDCDGNIINAGVVQFDSNELKDLVISDMFLYKTLPILSIFNKDNFNEKQLDNVIDFCMARLNEVDDLIATENYTEQIDEVVLGRLIKEVVDRKNYKVVYYKIDKSLISRKSAKRLEKIDALTVVRGKVEYSVSLDTMGDKFYGFIWSLIFNYLNKQTQELEKQTVEYKNKKIIVMESLSSIYREFILEVER